MTWLVKFGAESWTKLSFPLPPCFGTCGTLEFGAILSTFLDGWRVVKTESSHKPVIQFYVMTRPNLMRKEIEVHVHPDIWNWCDQQIKYSSDAAVCCSSDGNNYSPVVGTHLCIGMQGNMQAYCQHLLLKVENPPHLQQMLQTIDSPVNYK